MITPDRVQAMRQLQEKAEAQSSVREFAKIPAPAPQKEPSAVEETVHSMRAACEAMAARLGVTVGPKDLVIPVPIPLLEAIVDRLLAIEQRLP